MKEPPEGIEISHNYTQEEIESAFNTGFGYRISGINPRRDEQDRRYILLFANENGPYSDSVTQGRFEYIGEGLSGDQNKKSPGNSTLIDAISTDIPIYFFYKRARDDGWEYQGLVDVIDYEFREQDERNILAYIMEYREDFSSNGLYLIPVSQEWRMRFRNSVENPHNLSGYEEVPPQLVGYEELRIWGTTETDSAKKQAAIEKMEAGDYILFYHGGDFILGARVQRTFDNSDVGALIWSQPESRHIYILDEVTTDVPSVEQVWDWLGYEGREVVQGFTRVANERLARLRQEHGSLQAAIFNVEREPTEDEIEEEKSALEKVVDSPPQLTEDEELYTVSRRRARDSAFARLVREAYDSQCVFCGSQRETPKGNPETEAAHIYPKKEGGSDDVRNGISLCKLHHWAFDTGWLSISDEYKILVKEEPERNGYDEFKELGENKMRLPNEDAVKPHPMFLAEHRQLNGFHDD
ncbi:HNH endonuclease [Halohasta litchfieldiae]|jgi:putative restriction endonuclease|uniref:HNH endonuclease n=1 Tax=Halohasta litchfieldiae TaxID=1073996 RepID=A0A1H6SXM5_9EURY|nr:HNH endonuclease [Halohasta litchfieldiae]ATW87019.1 HNH endonuclease [Halohasta litchfieldiae]SEI72521.1 HNH endonuclease [Halohasta litchfieldiae]